MNVYSFNKEIINHIEIIIPKRPKGHSSPTARRGELCPFSIIFFPKGWQNPCWRKAFGCHRAIVSILLRIIETIAKEGHFIIPIGNHISFRWGGHIIRSEKVSYSVAP